MKTIRSLVLVLFLFFFVTFLMVPSTSCSHPLILINIQVTGAENLKPMMDELVRRNIRATVWLSGEEIAANCEYVRELSQAGHEIACKFVGSIEPETSYEEQKAELLAILEAAPSCIGQQIAGFRAKRFTANEHTYQLLDDFGIKYLVRSARSELLSVFTFKPYHYQDHNFAILPMPIRCAYGVNGSLCDTSAEGKLSPAELQQYMFAAIDHNIKIEEPLILEWHPELTNPDDTEGWWQCFLAVLNYLETKEPDIRFVTAEDIVSYYLKNSGSD